MNSFYVIAKRGDAFSKEKLAIALEQLKLERQDSNGKICMDCWYAHELTYGQWLVVTDSMVGKSILCCIITIDPFGWGTEAVKDEIRIRTKTILWGTSRVETFCHETH